MSRTSELFSKLATFDVAAYEDRAHRLGRAALAQDAGLVRQVRDLAADTAAARQDPDAPLGRWTRHAIETAGLFLDAQEYVLTQEKPRYEQYASALVLRHLLRVEGNSASPAEQAHIWITFRRILQAQLDFEMASLAGLRTPVKDDFSPEVCRNRYVKLTAVRDLIPTRSLRASVRGPVASRWLSDVVRDRSGASAVARLLVFPQTTCHDEVAFLRTIQLSECLFWGALICVRRALAAFHAGDLRAAVQHVRDATGFAAPLVRIFHAVRTMPPEHFLGFRDATGDASAVQCESWQLLDAHMYGVLPEKVEVLKRTPEVRHVLLLADPGFLPLVQVAGRLDDAPTQNALRDAIISLDQNLRSWRSFHTVQLAGRTDPGYLPPESPGSGGTSGYPYLASHRPPRASHLTGHARPSLPERVPAN